MLTLNKGTNFAIFSLLLTTCFSLLVLPSTALTEQYQLRCSISFSPSSPHQTETIVVSITVENLGDVPFNGEASLSVRTDQGHSYENQVFPISNLVRGTILNGSQAIRADDEGIYWAWLKIEESHLALMDLYSGSQLVGDNLARPEHTNSVFVMSLSDYNAQQNLFWTQISVVTSVGIALAGAITWRKKRRR